MINYPFVYPSAKENAPDVFKQMEAAKFPAVVEGEPSPAAARRDPPRRSPPSPSNPDLTFDAIECLVQPENQLPRRARRSAPADASRSMTTKGIDKAYPGFADLVRQSIENAAPRPQTPAYTDLSLAIQRALHPPSNLDPDDVDPRVRQALRPRRAGRQPGGAPVDGGEPTLKKPAAPARGPGPSASWAGCCARRRWQRCCWSPPIRSAMRSCSRSRSSTCASPTRAASSGLSNYEAVLTSRAVVAGRLQHHCS